ncbi:MAG: sigma-70 family RNA polymerase sigma factor [Bacteroidetes bacterium]|nr:sigma-70 family RNA polymerase sigma factor [Bacteroidota bacterium]
MQVISCAEDGQGNDVAYDITLETLMKFRKNLLIGKIQYGNMAALFTIDARNNYLRWREKETRYDEVSVESQEQVLTDETDDTSLNMERVQNLKRALLNIGKDCYELLNWHYYLKMTLRTIAESRFQRGDDKFVNEASVKTKVAECRKKLRTLLS